ncbi:MAG: Rrf2 family transcriptional regulator [Candidatus Aminicenantales bacterium]|jgi:Rrf2 family protein
MKLINRDADYAIKALLAVARRAGKVTAVPELAVTLGIPRPYLRKIMQTLARAGVVRSSKGRGGGFVLGRPAGKIFLADVIRVFQGPVSLHDCLFRKRICPDVGTCPLRETIGRLERRLVKDLETLSVASLLGGKKGRKNSRKGYFKGGSSPRPAQKRRRR